ncbi:MAG: TlpA family protein disulfide reductase [Aureliella sp.]
MSSEFSSESESTGATASQAKGPSGLLIMGLVGVSMLLGILFLAWLGTPRIEPAVGQTIARLDLKPLVFAEAPFTESDLKGKVTVLHFWGTWCPPCREEFPGFVKIAQEFASNGEVQFVSVSSSARAPEYDLDDLADQTRRFLEQHSTTVPTYADPAGMSRVQIAMLMADGSLPYPSTLVLDRNGIIAGVWIGYAPGGMEEVAATVKKLL